MEVNKLWLPIKGYEGIYEISSYGDIKSLARYINHPGFNNTVQYWREEKLLTGDIIPNGYRRVRLNKDDYFERILVHVLVYDHFWYLLSGIENNKRQDGILEVHHKNFIKLDNWIFNLELLTPKQNIRKNFDRYKCFV